MEVYNFIIYKIYTLLYSVKLNRKLTKIFNYRQSRICRDNISKIKYLSFSQVKTLQLRTLKKQLHIGTKLVKVRSITMIGIIMCLSLTGKHN